jgi:hypothetical protein
MQQASLFEQLEAEEQAKKQAEKELLERQRVRKYSRLHYHHGSNCGYKQYNPRLMKQTLLKEIGDEWVGFIGLARELGMHPNCKNRMLHKLIQWGYIEETPLYFRNDAHMLPDLRLQKPEKNYQGFEHGYRRIQNG